MQNLELFGHPNAFGVLTTVKKTWLFWLDDESSKIAADGDRFSGENIRKVANSLQEPTADGTPSPAVPRQPQKPPSPVDLVEEPGGGEIAPRKAYRSHECYEMHKLVPLLCNAIICGLTNIQQKQAPLDIQALAVPVKSILLRSCPQLGIEKASLAFGQLSIL